MVISPSDINISSMHVVISPGDANSYKVNEQGKYWTQVLQIFLTIKNTLLRKTCYRLYSFCYRTDLQGHSKWM